MDELPDGEKINWSAMARKYIPQNNGGQILKALANEKGIDVSKQDQQRVTPHQRCKKRLPGGEISTPCLPTKEEIKRLVQSSELTIGEPCIPYVVTKCNVNAEGEIEVTPSENCGRKIPLLELTQKLLNKQLKYMCIGNPRIKTSVEILQMAVSAGYQCSTSLSSLNPEAAYTKIEPY